MQRILEKLGCDGVELVCLLSMAAICLGMVIAEGMLISGLWQPN